MIQTMSRQDASAAPAAISHGMSQEAVYVATKKEKVRDRLRESFSFGFGLSRPYDELYEVAQECGVDGWDGYDAKPVSTATFLQAILFLKSLPLDVTAPSVGAEPDGDLTFEWYGSPSRTLSVSIGPDSVLHYAAVLGPRKAYGVEPFLGALPQVIVDLIRQIILA
jgi:hypothetical protein